MDLHEYIVGGVFRESSVTSDEEVIVLPNTNQVDHIIRGKPMTDDR